MELPYSLSQAISKLTEGLSVSDLSKAAQTLSQRYRGKKERSGQPLLTDRTEAAAYVVTRMPATYGAVYTALSWTMEHLDCRLQTLLDVGAGTGAATWAAQEILHPSSITCLEAEDSMKQRGIALMQGTELQSAAWVSGNLTREELPCQADLVLASYVLNEISQEQRNAVLDKLWNSTKELLLIVEPGTPDHFVQLREACAYLRSLGGFVAAPCPDVENCPITGEDWCHFTCRIPRSRLHRQLKGGEVPYEDEKFTYLAVSRKPCTPCISRVLRHPVIETGRVTLELCSPCGKQSMMLRKKDPEYKVARKLRCGDSFSTKS